MSSRIKTFEDKQRPLTPSERAALDDIKSKSLGRKIKEKPLTPDQLKLLDTEDFSAKDTPKGSDPNSIITEDDLKKEELDLKKKSEEVAKKFKKSYDKQIKDWSKNIKSDLDDYKNFEFEGDYYLVRVFAMDVSEFKGYRTLEYEWSRILKQWKITDKQLKNNVFPVVKILKVGDGFTETNPQKYDVGDICLVPSKDIVGEDWNPKFLHIMQFQNSQNMKPVLPEGMTQRIPNIELNWNNYMFSRPWILEPEQKDKLTYLIPSSKIKGSYKL